MSHWWISQISNVHSDIRFILYYQGANRSILFIMLFCPFYPSLFFIHLACLSLNTACQSLLKFASVSAFSLVSVLGRWLMCKNSCLTLSVNCGLCLHNVFFFVLPPFVLNAVLTGSKIKVQFSLSLHLLGTLGSILYKLSVPPCFSCIMCIWNRVRFVLKPTWKCVFKTQIQLVYIYYIIDIFYFSSTIILLCSLYHFPLKWLALWDLFCLSLSFYYIVSFCVCLVI